MVKKSILLIAIAGLLVGCGASTNAMEETTTDTSVSQKIEAMNNSDIESVSNEVADESSQTSVVEEVKTKLVEIEDYEAAIPEDWIDAYPFFYLKESKTPPMIHAYTESMFESLDDVQNHIDEYLDGVADGYENFNIMAEPHKVTYNDNEAVTVSFSGVLSGYDMQFQMDFLENPGNGVLVLTFGYETKDSSNSLNAYTDFLNSFAMTDEALKNLAEIEAEKNRPDFLKQFDSGTELHAMVNADQIQELYNMVSEYIDNENPDEEDSAFLIKEAIDPVIENFASFNIIKDDYKDATSVYYGNIIEISDDIHFVPHLDHGGGVTNGFKITMGFYANDWLFFDQVNYYGGTYVGIQSKSDKIQDVISGRGIYEAITYTYYYPDSLDTLDSLEKLSVQFENKSTGNTLEFEFTEEEAVALKNVEAYARMYNTLHDIFNDHFGLGR